MKGHVFLLVAIGLQVCYFVRAGPSVDPSAADEDLDSNGEPARGLKGQTNPLASLQKSHAKCTIEGSFGIKNECSKYTECRKKGQIPSFKYCPGGKFFDHKRRVCVKSSEALCKNVCQNDEEIFPDPTDGNGFLKCTKGVPMGHLCPDTQSFLPQKLQCSAGGAPVVLDDDE